MTEQELRVLVREAVERHMREGSVAAPERPTVRQHASHRLFTIAPGAAIDDGRCLIEPAVMCSHCGYCQSYGH